MLAQLTMSDDLPAGLILLSVTADSTWTCGIVDPVLCTHGVALEPNTFASPITLRVRVDPNFLGNSVTNTGIAIAVVDPSPQRVQTLRTQALRTEADPGTVVTAQDSVTTAIIRDSNLSIKKAASKSSVVNGEIFNWVLEVTNNGPDTAVNVVISDTIPAQFEIISPLPASGLTCTVTGNAVQCTAPSLANGAKISTDVQVKVRPEAAPGSVTNTASVASDSTDNVPGDNSASASVTIPAGASAPPAPPTPAVSASSGARCHARATAHSASP